MKTLAHHAAIEQYQALQEALESFVDQIRSHCTGVVAYQLPIVDADGTVPTEIPVTQSGALDSVEPEALDLACAAFKQLELTPGQKHNTTYRLPGCMFLTEDASESVEQINAMKSELKATLAKAYPKVVERSRACSLLFPHVHMNHVYRHIYTIPAQTSRVNFTWQCQTPADVWITPDDAIELAETALAIEVQANGESKPSGRQMALQIALKYFRSLPRAIKLTEEQLTGPEPPTIPYQLLQRNYVRPHPRVQLFAPPKGSRAIATHPCNLPLIYTVNENALNVRGLRDYKAGQSRRRSDIKTGFEEISSALHIFGGVPTVDMYLLKLHLNEKSRQRKNQQKLQGANSPDS